VRRVLEAARLNRGTELLGQRERFINSVTRGKGQMPPWGDFFKPDQLAALWAYVMAGER